MAAAKENMAALVATHVQVQKCIDLDIGSILARSNINKIEKWVAACEAAGKVLDQAGRADDSSASAGIGQSPGEVSAGVAKAEVNERSSVDQS